MIHFVGAGCGAPDLITLRGKKHIENADVIVYAGSLVNKELLQFAKKDCAIYDSSKMTLEEIIKVIAAAEREGLSVVRLHTGDPSLYGAIGEQMQELDRLGIEYDITPGVSAFSGAAASLKAEYTLPDVSQTVIITRAAGRTGVPGSEDLRSLASHGATMVLYLSAGLL
ncbi:MAG: cobalt-precorrin-4/precorrin-4 C(11)-methyltransferase, partial [Spirochaetia bacterium]|nr:cobalt-precorrin-4/precorrin-4 C(11)-methyltransferase [Spirochaetia bacterium]